MGLSLIEGNSCDHISDEGGSANGLNSHQEFISTAIVIDT